MSAPLPVEFASLNAALAVPLPCPSCGAPLAPATLAGSPPTLPAPCPQCGVVSGAPARFVDTSLRTPRRRALRPVFSAHRGQACRRCNGHLQRVLLDDQPASFCAACNVVVVDGRRRAHVSVGPPRARVVRIVAEAVGVVVAAVVAVVLVVQGLLRYWTS